MTLRSLIFWPHLIAGVLAGLLILLMSVTGVFLTYERQLIAWSDRAFQSTPPTEDAPRLEIAAVLARVREARPDLEVASATVTADRTAPVALTAGQRTVYADAYSGAVLGEGTRGMRQAMSTLRAWHRWLAVEGDNRPLARAMTGWANVIFLFIIASGTYLWIPRRLSWSHLRPVLLFTGKATGKARDFNWHNVIGFWCAIPLFIVVATAVPISFPWANAWVYQAVGDTPPAAGGREGGGGREGRGGAREGRGGARDGGGGGRQDRPAAEQRARGTASADAERSAPTQFVHLNRLFAIAEGEVSDWRTITVRMPQTASEPVAFSIDRGDGGQPHLRSTVTLSSAGEIVSREAFSDLTPGRQLRSLMRFAHTGEVIGLGGQTIAGMVSAGGVVLVWTGVALAWRRYRAWAIRRVHAPAAVGSSQEANLQAYRSS